MRKIYVVPNIVTTANMFCGFYSIIASMHNNFIAAAWAVLAAAVFDMLDGRIARLAKATSQFGIEYDSLSDLVSFGMAPGVLLYQWALEPFGRLGWIAAFLFVVCAALRLARFNVNTGILPKNFFQGLPVPMAAGVIATFIIFNRSAGWPPEVNGGHEPRQIMALVLTFGLASLMVSTIRFPSFKDLNWRSRTSFGYLLIGVLSMLLIAVKPEITLFLLISAYVALSIAWNVFRLVFRGSHLESHAAGSARNDARQPGA